MDKLVDKLEARALYFFLLALLMFFISFLFFCYYRKKKKINEKSKFKKKKEIKDYKYWSIFMSFCGFLSLMLMGEYVIDAQKKDYIVETGVFVDYRRNKFEFYASFDIGGKEEDYWVSSEHLRMLEEGKKYRFTYGARSEYIIELVPLDGVKDDE